MALSKDEKEMPGIQFSLEDLLEDTRNALDKLMPHDSADEFSDTTLLGYLATIHGEHETAGEMIQQTAVTAFTYFKARPDSGYEEGMRTARANARDPRGLELDAERDRKRHEERVAATKAFIEEQRRRNGITPRSR
jgi:hypothetical protein